MKQYSIEGQYTKKKICKNHVFEKNEALKNLWKNYNQGSGLMKPEYYAVLTQIKRFVGQIFQTIMSEDEFFATWIDSKNEWCK